MGVWYGPMFCVTIGLSILYIGIVMKIRSMLNIWRETLTPEVDKKSLKGEVLPLLFYPLVYIILYIIPIVNRIHNAMYPKDPEFELVVLAAISATSLGAANSLIYGLDKETLGKLTLREIKNAWLSHFPPKAKAGEYSTESKTGDSQTEAKKAYSDTMSSGASQTEVKLQYSMEIYSVSAQCDGSTASDKMPSRRQASNLP
ncbi:uncharacterized protein LOC135479464 [Liolophura sinensis]|uniref:uncharacterized protein LOC135479464 n=1 Tax=Liolophura sinensis TaxID=3198878 RepID=UPI0031589BD1